ncbi:MAG: CPBP family intramembrane glutamic endopeptidase [Gilvibacter sp.]
MELKQKRTIVLLSPFLIIAINFATAYIAGDLIGKWAFVPIILIEWVLFMVVVLWAGGTAAITRWLKPPKKKRLYLLLALLSGCIPIPIFMMHYQLLAPIHIWAPWLILALVNPWIEEFYWRGILLEHSAHWKLWQAVLFTSFVFALNHVVFGVNSELNQGVTVFASTFIMGVLWAIIFKKTVSLRWVILAHFMVDVFNLSVPSFLDLYEGFGG